MNRYFFPFCIAVFLIGCPDSGEPGAVFVLEEEPQAAEGGADTGPEDPVQPEDPELPAQPIERPEPVVDVPAEDPVVDPRDADLTLCLTRADANPVDWTTLKMQSHSNAGRLEVVDDVALLTDAYGPSTAWWLHAVELTDPLWTSAATLDDGDKWAGSNAGYDLLVEGDLAYVTTLAGLRVLDVTDPLVPQVVAALDVGTLSGLARYSDYLVARRWNGLVVFDLTEPSAPTVLAEHELGGSGLTMDGSRAYLFAEEDRIDIYELADPENPQLLGSHQGTPWLMGSVAVSNEVLYLVEAEKVGDSGPPLARLRAMDVSDPAAPVELDSVPVPFSWTYSLWADGDTLYVNGEGLLHRFDTSDPSALTPTGPQLVGCSGRVTTSDTHLQLACSGAPRAVELPFETPWGSTPVGIGIGTYDLAVWGRLRVCRDGPGGRGVRRGGSKGAGPHGKIPWIQWLQHQPAGGWRLSGRG